MRLAYFDCFSGISGDMVLGAMVDAGLELSRIESELHRLLLSGWSLETEKVKRGAMAATMVQVAIAEKHHHRGLGEILQIIAAAGLSQRAAARASAIFRRLGEAEARVHNVPVEKVHFHEVGAVDAILDIVGACVGFELLGIEEFVGSPLNVGGGSVKTAHGILPVPAPATVDLLRGAPTYSTGIDRELVTPTGAAIVSTLVTRYGPLPPMRATAVGYGAGTFELAEQPNVMRLILGERAERGVPAWDETLTVIEANIDDMNPQIYGYLAEQALAGGALDIFSAPVQMKKNRPGMQVTLLCEPADADRLIELVFRETTTLGVRTSEARRRTLERDMLEVETPHGRVRMKVARLDGRVLNVAPEFEDCRRIAAEHCVPLKQVMAEATASFAKRGENR